LTNATGSWSTPNNKTSAYTLGMVYDGIHNIKSKDQNHTLSSSPKNAITHVAVRPLSKNLDVPGWSMPGIGFRNKTL
jgi:hypothetical protein